MRRGLNRREGVRLDRGDSLIEVKCRAQPNVGPDYYSVYFCAPDRQISTLLSRIVDNYCYWMKVQVKCPPDTPHVHLAKGRRYPDSGSLIDVISTVGELRQYMDVNRPKCSSLFLHIQLVTVIDTDKKDDEKNEEDSDEEEVETFGEDSDKEENEIIDEDKFSQ